MTLKPATQNTFQRLGIIPGDYPGDKKDTPVTNWLSGVTVETTPLIAHCIRKVYELTLRIERGDQSIRIDDFDRLRYFILEQDSNAYMECID